MWTQLSSTFVSFGKTLLTQDTNLGYFSYQARIPSWYHKFREEIVALLMKQNHVSLVLIVYPHTILATGPFHLHTLLFTWHWNFLKKDWNLGPYGSTVKDGRKITQNVLGEHKVITTEQQFLGVILSFFMHLRWLWLLRFFA